MEAVPRRPVLNARATASSPFPGHWSSSARSATADFDAGIANQTGLTSCLLPTRDFAKVAAAQWDNLRDHTLVENPFYSQTFVTGGLKTIDANNNVEAFAIWSGTRDLVGLFPVRILFGTGYGAQNIYQFNGAPLVHCEYAEGVVHAWLVAIREGELPGCWQLPNLQLNTPLHDLIRETALRCGLSVAVSDTYSRAQLSRVDGGFQAHLNQVFGRSRKKELERCMRRLREQGALRFERASTPDTVRSSLGEFLVLENAGWKGRAGTSFLTCGDDASFARAVLTNDGAGYGAIIDTLFLNDRPIAMSVNITSGSILFTPKCTYCELMRSYAPGLVLEYLIIEHFYRDSTFIHMDAATLADGHVIQGLWNETVPMGTLYVGSAAKTARAVYLARAKAALKPGAKLVRDYLRSTWRRAHPRRR